MVITDINTSLNSEEIFNLFAKDRGVFFLDSGMDHNNLGRFSFIGSKPYMRFKSSNHDLEEIKKIEFELGRHNLANESSFPFTGGAVGYITYEIGNNIEQVISKVDSLFGSSRVEFGIYDGIIAIDHKKGRTVAIAHGIEKSASDIIRELKDRVENGDATIDREVNSKKIYSNFTKARYMRSVDRIRELISEGEIYQANLTQQFKFHSEDNPVNIYNNLRKINPAPFAAYLDCGATKIISSSPERFIKRSDDIIETRPIKGTIAKSSDPKVNLDRKEQLQSSSKDRSELLMIVDLERNDFGKIAEIGSVKVPELFKIEEYPTLYHLVSTVIAKVDKSVTFYDLIEATFPGGSITGTPKRAAIKALVELENEERGIYTGFIGYIDFNGNFDSNIPIRTIEINGNVGRFNVGGGVIWDSDPESEYDESMDKAKALIEALNAEKSEIKRESYETIMLKNGELKLTELHLKRLQKSCNIEVKIPLDLISKSKIKNGALRISVVDNITTFRLDRRGYSQQQKECGFRLKSIQGERNSVDEKHNHKITDPDLISKLDSIRVDGYDEAILLNEKGELTETFTSNIFFVKDRVIYTPSLECGILPGTIRSLILPDAIEGVFYLSDIKSADEVFISNSLMEIIPVVSIDEINFEIGSTTEKISKLISQYHN